MGIYDELKNRGFIVQCTNEEKVKDLLDNHKITFYIGFEPTANSLHVGHFVQLMVMSHLQKSGHTPIILFGGGTGMIGDPSGKTDMRKMMSPEEISFNIECFKKQADKFIDFTENKALVVNNADWLMNLNYIEFLREIGVHFSVNRMLAAECYKQRLEKGLSFFELNYMIMQSYDFLVLNRKYNCILEFGGDDQWSNIIGGVELIRRVDRKEVYGVTSALLTTNEGKKMGKTEKGALWLDANKTSPYEFYQYWRNVNDKDVIKCFKTLTFLPLDQISQYESLEGEKINSAKENLAFEITKLVHGEEEAVKAQNTSREIFQNGNDSENMLSSQISSSDLTDGKIDIVTLLIKMDLVKSRGEARRLIQQNGISLNNNKIDNIDFLISESELKKGCVIKKGKKIYKKAIL